MSSELLVVDSLQVEYPFYPGSLYDAKGDWVDANEILASLRKWERKFIGGNSKNTVKFAPPSADALPDGVSVPVPGSNQEL